jgi:hypothetical protein
LADHFTGGSGCLVGVVAEVNAAFEAVFESAFSAATGMDLGFHHDVCDACPSELCGDFSGFVRAVCDFAAGGCDSVFFKKLSGLVFVDVHGEWCEMVLEGLLGFFFRQMQAFSFGPDEKPACVLGSNWPGPQGD